MKNPSQLTWLGSFDSIYTTMSYRIRLDQVEFRFSELDKQVWFDLTKSGFGFILKCQLRTLCCTLYIMFFFLLSTLLTPLHSGSGTALAIFSLLLCSRCVRCLVDCFETCHRRCDSFSEQIDGPLCPGGIAPDTAMTSPGYILVISLSIARLQTVVLLWLRGFRWNSRLSRWRHRKTKWTPDCGVGLPLHVAATQSL